MERSHIMNAIVMSPDNVPEEVPERLVAAVRHYEQGAFRQSLDDLEMLQRYGPEQYAQFRDQIHILAAKDNFHLGNDQAAYDCLANLGLNASSYSPDVRAEYEIIHGLLVMRKANRLRQSGGVESAYLLCAEANSRFRLAAFLAYISGTKVLHYSASLDRAYAKGLSASLSGQSLVENPKLVGKAIDAEIGLRMWSPPALRNDIGGVNIIADLARGAALSTKDVLHSVPDEKRVLYATVLKSEHGRLLEWPELILGTIRENFSWRQKRPLAVLQGAVLGAKMLLKSYPELLPTHGRAFQVELLTGALSIDEAGCQTAHRATAIQMIRDIDERRGSVFLRSRRALR